MTHFAPFITAHATSVPAFTLADDALTAVRRHLGMPLAYLSVFEGEEVVFRTVSSDQDNPLMASGDRRPAEGTYCKAVRDGKLPQMIPDTQKNAYAANLEVTLAGPIGAMMAIPLILRDGTTYGMFCCLAHEAMPALNERDHAIMTTFATLVAETIGSEIDADRVGSALRQQIRDVIADRDFQILFQPIISMTDMSIMGAEALCRFRPGPYRSPDKWFTQSRSVGLGRELERAVVRKTLSLLSELPLTVNLSINVSPDMMINGDLPDLIDGPFSNRIILELTEHEDFCRTTDLKRAMNHLRRLGARIAVDDLGAAYASLNTVLQIKPDIVKLDREMVRGINLDPASRALTAGIAHFADAIGAKIVAERIETKEELATLRELGVAFGQGYLLGRPGGITALSPRSSAS